MTTFDEDWREVGAARYRVIQIHGECGLPDVDELQATLDLAAGTEEGVVIGLEHCEFIDSMALASLVRAHSRGREKGRQLVMAAPTAQIRRILGVSRLDTDGLVFDSVEDAIAGGQAGSAGITTTWDRLTEDLRSS
ncbi:MAG TPA: STAS domain-containing protein [Solirubrobacterales bacterium]|jgi:anti-anti-sigma factor